MTVIQFLNRFGWILLGGGFALGADGPRLDLIELFSTNQVTIHFSTEPGRAYTLQYTDSVCRASTGGGQVLDCTVWTALFAVPSFPFPNHYVIVDGRQATQRTYRLQVTP